MLWCSTIYVNKIISFQHGKCGFSVKEPTSAHCYWWKPPVVINASKTPSRSAAVLPRTVPLSIFSLPRGSLTWSKPLSILFIILHHVTSLFTGFIPTELFLYRMCIGEAGIAGQTPLLGLIGDIFSISARCQNWVSSVYHRTWDPVLDNAWKSLHGLHLT